MEMEKASNVRGGGFRGKLSIVLIGHYICFPSGK